MLYKIIDICKYLSSYEHLMAELSPSVCFVLRVAVPGQYLRLKGFYSDLVVRRWVQAWRAHCIEVFSFDQHRAVRLPAMLSSKRRFDEVTAEVGGNAVWLRNGVPMKKLKMINQKVSVDNGPLHGFVHSYNHSELMENCLNINFSNSGCSTEFA